MQIARVRGTVTSTQKDPSLRGVKLLMLQLVDENGNLLPVYEVAADNSVGAGVNEWVLVSRGSAARQVLGNEQRPLDAAVVAIIDTIYVEDRVIYSKKDQL
ncbi:EutN/CcmL family microcompartment protein [Dolichospermum planctonicum CS-1226]|jgi:carbon dioxide concentrating mechanism protein CcmL|uniref:Carboxysome shell vertex protein CcmL n=1 Tax=Dolichospermum planctonicum CS-1226 TaxID=3021751 RepID=A0ABT5AKG8_9CYAN|nr:MULTISPECIES: EutN/CcmL family microcompartment protein [Dolichospermum]MBD1211829.1 EutN/CcmL family microcompartment protein [Dolichospermum circinale Clear-D4]MCE2717442.1 EutN/CcmL family microcompartment protein [Anabaena sp. 49628_E55]MDB9483158.1 EutN/CcmL family microcompartment protein [Dolichospermum circinale CS-537/05]OBQ37638.1 MAG: carbon dioxide concentrating mechanism protein CcmL [Anabaena sp. CRKS33]MCW9679389.1 EutN/CcmL family microcompartment protein [Dolichospermum pla